MCRRIITTIDFIGGLCEDLSSMNHYSTNWSFAVIVSNLGVSVHLAVIFNGQGKPLSLRTREFVDVGKRHASSKIAKCKNLMDR